MSNDLKEITKPTKDEQEIAIESHPKLIEALKNLKSPFPEIGIQETEDKIKIPLKLLKLLAKILEVTSQGKPFSIVPIATELTTQSAADFLGCSRPHLIKLLEQGDIAFKKIGKHRRILFEDLAKYKRKKKKEQEQLLIEIMKADEETGLYDT